MRSQHVDRCTELGNKLTVDIKPKSAPQREDPAAKRAADAANRCWTLVVNGYLEVGKAAFEIWGPSYRDHIPALQSRAVHKKKDDTQKQEQAQPEQKAETAKKPEKE